ncbi:hypothetical protein [Phormidesmis priestleyi]
MAQLQTHLHLDWQYEDENQVVAPSLLEDCFDLVAPDPTELDTLLDLARMGDLKGILEQTVRLEKTPQWVPFALHLRHLAQEFKERQILELIKRYRRNL